jgi:copper chaperone CopZ
MTETLRVTGMTCGGCENAVKRAVGKLPGVVEVTASHIEQQVGVTYDPSKVELAAIKEKIEKLGYRVGEKA